MLIWVASFWVVLELLFEEIKNKIKKIEINYKNEDTVLEVKSEFGTIG